MHRRSKT